jgi:hypothetical protein
VSMDRDVRADEYEYRDENVRNTCLTVITENWFKADTSLFEVCDCCACARTRLLTSVIATQILELLDVEEEEETGALVS